jgi:hypothetical protein
VEEKIIQNTDIGTHLRIWKLEETKNKKLKKITSYTSRMGPNASDQIR